MQSSRQWQDYLLCSECENLFSRNGESWVLPLLAKSDGTFAFHKILVKHGPESVLDGSALYAAAKNPEIDIAKLTHFAMGIFWKASVHSWSGERTSSLIDLGSYGEQVRKFLKAEEDFPERMALIVGISPPPLLPTFNIPYRGSERNFHNFLFHVPGINFVLNVGKLVSSEMKELCFASQPLHPITCVKNLQRKNIEIAKETVAGAHKAAGLLKYARDSKEFADYSKKKG